MVASRLVLEAISALALKKSQGRAVRYEPSDSTPGA